MIDTLVKIIGTVVGVVVIVFGIALVVAWPTEIAWNYVMPYLFGFKTISIRQAFALNFLATALIQSATASNSGKRP